AFAVVDQLVGARIARDLQLLLAGSGSDYPRAHGLADFHRSQTDATGGTQHQQGLAGLQLAALGQRVHGGAIGHAEAGGGDVIHVIGHGQHTEGVSRDLFGKAAVAGQAHDPVAGLEVPDLRSDAGHHTGGLAAGGEGEFRFDLIFAFDDQGIREVDAGGVDVDDHFVVAGYRIGSLFQRQAAGRTVGFAQYGFHDGSLLSNFFIV